MSDNGGLSDKLKSAVSKGKGEIKDQVGNATGDRQKQNEGKMDKAKGEFQKTVGEFKDATKPKH
ncbi:MULTISPECIES: CsbD family protein [Planomicrobium]|uniref:CsbD-like protein n=1 Tax=Planomicrobium soli TaxID=1176648 RepID=A0A2P8GCC3_9BACL|nr:MULTISPECIES: CsbD family protein [Planomicrobium]PSL31628.1 CsbD-like protein [Planomicrobium soli]TWT04898.1 CsbD family protein [Planomicrobium sp. CPCC 101079]